MPASSLVKRFDQANTDVFQFLRDHADASAPEQCEVLLFDLRRRYESHQLVDLQDWLARSPQVACHPELKLRLVMGEFQARERYGHRPSLDDYIRQFPDLETELRQHLSATVHYQPGADPSGSPTALVQSSNPEGESPDEFGDYVIEEEIARGGMGVVFKATQKSLGRTVALKMIKSGELADAEEVSRFRTEAEAAAQLDHPNIVPIYEVGEHAGRPFFSMGYVAGESLQSRLSQGPLPSADAARLVKTVAEALAYAHSKGVIHRDLKPSNILLEEDRQGAALRAKVSDFGLAKLVGSDSGLTATGQVMGTPSYMPPEQAAGRSEAVGPRSDVYSLGAVLYHLLTGRPPFQAASVLETLQQVAEREPVSPRMLNPTVHRDLETVCLKCLEKDAGRRYGSAHALLDELDRFLANKPVLARPVGPAERAWRWCRRNRPAAAVILLLCLFAVAGPLVALRQMELSGQAKREKSRADGKVLELIAANARLTRSLASEKTALALSNRSLNRADDAVETFLASIADEQGVLSGLPATQKLRQSMLLKARSYYLELIRDHQADQLSPRLAAATLQLARISAQITGMNRQAVGAYREAISLYERLVKEDPENVDYLGRAAVAQLDLASLYDEMGQDAESRATFDRCIRALEQLAAEHPEPRFQGQLASAYNFRGSVHYKAGQLSEALAAYRKADAIHIQLERENQSAENAYYLGITRCNIGMIHRDLGSDDLARECFQQAADAYTSIAAGSEYYMYGRQGLAYCFTEIGILDEREADWPESLAHYQRAFEIHRQLKDESPDIAALQHEFALACDKVAFAHFQLGDFARAEELLVLGVQTQGKICEQNPNVTMYRNRLARLQIALALAHFNQARREDAVRYLELARAELDELVRDEPAPVEHRRLLAYAIRHLAFMHENNDERRLALDDYHHSLYLLDQLCREFPEVSEYCVEAANSRLRLARFLHSTSPLQAAALVARAERELERVVEREPKLAKAREFLQEIGDFWSASQLSAKDALPGSTEAFVTLKANAGATLDVAVTPDGRHVIGISEDGGAALWRIRDGSLMAAETAPTPVRGGACSPDGSWCCAVGEEDTIQLWFVNDGKLTSDTVPTDHQVVAMALLSDSRTIITGGPLGGVVSRDVRSGRTIRSTEHDDAISCLRPTADLKSLAMASRDGTVTIWSVAPPKVVARLNAHQGPVVDVAVSPDRESILTLGKDKKLRIWSRDGMLLQDVELPEAVSAAVYSPDGSYVATGGAQSIEIRHAADLTTALVLADNEEAVSALAYSPDGACLIAGSTEHGVRVFNLPKELWPSTRQPADATAAASGAPPTNRVEGPSSPIVASPESDELVSTEWRLRSETEVDGNSDIDIYNLADKPVQLVWLDFNGTRSDTIASVVTPGNLVSRSTYPGHLWIVADMDTGRTIGIFRAQHDRRLVMVHHDDFDVDRTEPSDAAPHALRFAQRENAFFTPLRIDGAPMTMECLARPEHVNVRQFAVVMSDTEGAGMGLVLTKQWSSEARWAFYAHDGKAYRYAQAKQPAVPRREVHLAGVWDGQELRLYVDGVLSARTPMKTFKSSRFPLMIGADPPGSNSFRPQMRQP